MLSDVCLVMFAYLCMLSYELIKRPAFLKVTDGDTGMVNHVRVAILCKEHRRCAEYQTIEDDCGQEQRTETWLLRLVT